eukprot:jgi/Bigna1/74292/fgenesh1_pg.28_\
MATKTIINNIHESSFLVAEPSPPTVNATAGPSTTHIHNGFNWVTFNKDAKIAVLLSGQPRSFMKVKRHMESALIYPNNADVFVHLNLDRCSRSDLSVFHYLQKADYVKSISASISSIGDVADVKRELRGDFKVYDMDKEINLDENEVYEVDKWQLQQKKVLRKIFFLRVIMCLGVLVIIVPLGTRVYIVIPPKRLRVILPYLLLGSCFLFLAVGYFSWILGNVFKDAPFFAIAGRRTSHPSQQRGMSIVENLRYQYAETYGVNYSLSVRLRPDLDIGIDANYTFDLKPYIQTVGDGDLFAVTYDYRTCLLRCKNWKKYCPKGSLYQRGGYCYIISTVFNSLSSFLKQGVSSCLCSGPHWRCGLELDEKGRSPEQKLLPGARRSDEEEEGEDFTAAAAAAAASYASERRRGGQEEQRVTTTLLYCQPPLTPRPFLKLERMPIRNTSFRVIFSDHIFFGHPTAVRAAMHGYKHSAAALRSKQMHFGEGLPPSESMVWRPLINFASITITTVQLPYGLRRLGARQAALCSGSDKKSVLNPNDVDEWEGRLPTLIQPPDIDSTAAAAGFPANITFNNYNWVPYNRIKHFAVFLRGSSSRLSLSAVGNFERSWNRTLELADVYIELTQCANRVSNEELKAVHYLRAAYYVKALLLDITICTQPAADTLSSPRNRKDQRTCDERSMNPMKFKVGRSAVEESGGVYQRVFCFRVDGGEIVHMQ